MTTAILVAATPAREGCAALLRAGDETLLGRLGAQLQQAGAGELLVLTRAEWVSACKEALTHVAIPVSVEQVAHPASIFETIARRLGAAGGAVVIAQAEILTHRGAVESLLKDPRIGSGVLVHAGEGGWPVRVERGRVTGASSPYHRTSGARARSLGLLLIADGARDAAARVSREAGELAGAMPHAWRAELDRRAAALTPEEVAAAPWDIVAVLTVGLVRADVPLRCAYLRALFWARPLSGAAADSAAHAMAAVDEERLLMDSSVKAADGFFGTFFCSPYTKHIARVFARWGVHPNHVTIFSFGLGLASAASFAIGSRAALIAGAVLLYFTLAFDCVDGQLARYSKRYTSLGAWLDPMFDRAKEYAVLGALAIGAVRTGAASDTTWLLAGAALTMQTVRHFMDFSYAAARQVVQATPRIVPLAEAADDPSAAAGDEVVVATGEPDEFSEGHDAAPAGTTVRARVIGGSARLNRVPWLVWVKRIIGFPIGERYAAISITAALAGASAVFQVLLVWGAIALAYSTVGRVVRSTL